MHCSKYIFLITRVCHLFAQLQGSSLSRRYLPFIRCFHECVVKSVCSKPFSFPWASSARLSTSFARHNVFHIPSAFFCISFYISVRRTLVFWITEYCSWLQSCSQPWAMLQPVVENRNVMMYRAWTCFRGLAKDYCLSAQNSMDSYVATGAKTKNSDLVTSSI